MAITPEEAIQAAADCVRAFEHESARVWLQIAEVAAKTVGNDPEDETAYLLSTPANRDRLLRAAAEHRAAVDREFVVNAKAVASTAPILELDGPTYAQLKEQYAMLLDGYQIALKLIKQLEDKAGDAPE